jgi:phage tail sheath gpL-like
VTDELEEYDDDEINALIGAGVTPVRREGSMAYIVRAVTTRTKNGDVYDASWRDINTVLIADNVITQIRDVLKGMFSRAKNTVRTRGAVRTQVVIELEKKLDAGIIDGYGGVTVTRSEDDPTVCLVSFEFSPACGMHQIIISAYITI